jgi:microcompartment protein CcmK/EutM
VFLAKVIGKVVSSQKAATLDGKKLLLIMPHITKDGKQVPSGSSIVAVDSVNAGEGQYVMFTQGSSARLTDVTKNCPVDAVVIGIVDSVEIAGVRSELPGA